MADVLFRVNAGLGMERPFLVGHKLSLRPLEASDVGEAYVSWLNDPQVTRYMETGRTPSMVSSVQQYVERFRGSTTDFIFAIIDRASNRHIGNVTLNRINWHHRTGDTGLMIGCKEFWGKGYAFEAWGLLLDYAFHRLGLHKIVAGAVTDNVAAVAVLRKLGFTVEGVFRQEVFVEGAYRDCLRFGLLREEFRNGNVPHTGMTHGRIDAHDG